MLQERWSVVGYDHKNMSPTSVTTAEYTVPAIKLQINATVISSIMFASILTRIVWIWCVKLRVL